MGLLLRRHLAVDAEVWDGVLLLQQLLVAPVKKLPDSALEFPDGVVELPCIPAVSDVGI